MLDSEKDGLEGRKVERKYHNFNITPDYRGRRKGSIGKKRVI